jgi:hypothetical protein
MLMCGLSEGPCATFHYRPMPSNTFLNLPEIEENQLLNLPPLDIPQHQLAEEGLGIGG